MKLSGTTEIVSMQLVAYPQTGKRFFMSDRLGLRSEINRNGSSSS